MQSGQALRSTGLLIFHRNCRQLFTSAEDVCEGTKWDIGAVSERLIRQALRWKVLGMLLKCYGLVVQLWVVLEEPSAPLH
jgi:hypothetical protein